MDSESTKLLKQLEVAIDSKEFPKVNVDLHHDSFFRKLEANLLTDMIAATGRALGNAPECYSNRLLQKLEDTFQIGTQEGDEENTTKSSLESLIPSKHHEKPPEKPKAFQIMMDVYKFPSKDIDIKVVGQQLIVHGKHETQLDYHGMVSREFTRKFEIPEDIDIETFRAIIDCYSVLRIEASRKPVNKNKVLDVMVQEYIDSENPLESLKFAKDLKVEEFEELMKRHISDGMGMVRFAQKLMGKHPCDYIPHEEIID